MMTSLSIVCFSVKNVHKKEDLMAFYLFLVPLNQCQFLALIKVVPILFSNS